MRLRHLPCLLIASLMLLGCKHYPQPSTPLTPPPLNTDLAKPCDQLQKPGAPDYDVWQLWTQDMVLKAYADCAARHAATVKAWPK
jgi:hypothetical protein